MEKFGGFAAATFGGGNVVEKDVVQNCFCWKPVRRCLVSVPYPTGRSTITQQSSSCRDSCRSVVAVVVDKGRVVLMERLCRPKSSGQWRSHTMLV